MPKRKHDDTDELENFKWNKLETCMKKWLKRREGSKLYSKRKWLKISKALTNYLDSLGVELSSVDRSRLMDVRQFLDLESEHTKIDGLKYRLSYLDAFKQMNEMHVIIQNLAGRMGFRVRSKKKHMLRMLNKLEGHYVLSHQDCLRYVYDHECQLRSELRKLKLVEYEPLEDEVKWLSIQKEVLSLLQSRLGADLVQIKKLYKVREKALTAAISMVENLVSAASFLYQTLCHVSVKAKVPPSLKASPVRRREASPVRRREALPVRRREATA